MASKAELIHKTAVLMRLTVGELDRYIEKLDELRGNLKWTLAAIEETEQSDGSGGGE